MVKKMKKHLRTIVQVGFTAVTNGYLMGFAKGSIYKGPMKKEIGRAHV